MRAAGTADDAAVGPWVFASVALALALVAGLAFLLGRATHPSEKRAAASVSATSGTSTAALPASAPTDDTATLAAVLTVAPRQLRVFRQSDGGQWVAVPAAHRPEQSAQSAQDLPRQWTAAAQALAPESSALLQGWTLQRSGVGAQERLLAWQHRDPAADQANAALSSADASREAATFSYTVSHDLRAPLRVVDGFARILKEDYGRQFDRIGNDHLDRVLAAAARMNTMIDAMLSLARLSSQPLARQPVNLSQMADYVIEDLRRSTPQRTVDATIEPDLHAEGDPTLLRLVLENLLSNAWKYTGRCDSASIALRSRLHEGRRVFEVSDNGAGFDMRSADRLFGLFQRLHSQTDFPGTGVGLASVQRIVRRHGGDIWVQSTPGQGACFSFTLGE